MKQSLPYEYSSTQDTHMVSMMLSIAKLMQSEHLVHLRSDEVVKLFTRMADIGHDFPNFLLENGVELQPDVSINVVLSPISLNIPTRVIHEWMTKPFSELYVGIVNRNTVSYWVYHPTSNTVTLPLDALVPSVSLFGVKIENPQAFIERSRSYLEETLTTVEAASSFTSDLIRTLKLLNKSPDTEPVPKEIGLRVIQGKYKPGKD